MENEFDVAAEMIKAAQDIFSTMLMVELESDPVVIDTGQIVQSNITSMIGLGGGIRGVLAIHCPASVAKAITSGFLGMDVEELDDDVKDAIGEVANMVAGNLKVAYASVDIQIELAIPTSIVGDHFNVCGAAKAQRVLAPLRMADEKFWIELMYVAN